MHCYYFAVQLQLKKQNYPILHYSKGVCFNRKYTKNTIVIFESTVFPGCTDEFCMPLIEKISKLKLNKDLFYGYSPERINPGDNFHSLNKINKLVGGSNIKTSKKIKSSMNNYKSKSFFNSKYKNCRGSKISENTQRDLNIALINEFAMILNKLNIDTKKVIDAASTKWNFHFSSWLSRWSLCWG